MAKCRDITEDIYVGGFHGLDGEVFFKVANTENEPTYNFICNNCVDDLLNKNILKTTIDLYSPFMYNYMRYIEIPCCACYNISHKENVNDIVAPGIDNIYDFHNTITGKTNTYTVLYRNTLLSIIYKRYKSSIIKIYCFNEEKKIPSRIGPEKQKKLIMEFKRVKNNPTICAECIHALLRFGIIQCYHK